MPENRPTRRRRSLTGVAVLSIAAAGAAWSGCGEDEQTQEAEEFQEGINDLAEGAEEGFEQADEEAEETQRQADEALEEAESNLSQEEKDAQYPIDQGGK